MVMPKIVVVYEVVVGFEYPDECDFYEIDELVLNLFGRYGDSEITCSPASSPELTVRCSSVESAAECYRDAAYNLHQLGCVIDNKP